LAQALVGNRSEAGQGRAWFLEDDALEQASGQLKVAQIAASMLDA
jgi:streptomycin 6-kinase